MSQTIGNFLDGFSWNETLFEVEDLYLLLINGAAIDYNEYSQRTGEITAQPIPVSTAASATDNTNRMIYLSQSNSSIDVYDIDTKLFVSTLTITPAMPGVSSAGAYNPSDGLLYFYNNIAGVPNFMSIDPNSGARDVLVAKPTIPTAVGSSSLAISADGRFYWRHCNDIGGGQWRFRMFSWTIAQPIPVILLDQNFPNPIKNAHGSTWQIDNIVYFSDVIDNTLWSYDIASNTVNLFEDNITVANSMGSYTLGPVPGVCFRRSYKQELDGTVTFTDSDFNGDPYTLVGGVDCDSTGTLKSFLTQDRVMTAGDTITFNANTQRSIYIQPLIGTIDINGQTLPTASIFEVQLPNRVSNQLGSAYTIDNITGTTYIMNTRYV